MTELQAQRARWDALRRQHERDFAATQGFELMGAAEPDAGRRLLADDFLERQREGEAAELKRMFGLEELL
jgi:hypothetical protein